MKDFKPQFLSNKRKIILFSLISLLFLGVVFFTLLATRIFDPLWNPFRPKPEKVLERMLFEIEKVKTGQSKIKVFIKGENENEIETNFDLNLKKDFSLKDKPKYETEFEISFSFTQKGKPLGLKFFLGGMSRTVDETTYFKLTKLPQIPLDSLTLDLFSSIKDQWIKWDEKWFYQLLEISEEGKIPQTKEFFREKTEEEKSIEKEFR